MKTITTKRAFTLIETFVAISILLVSLSGPLSIAAEALKSAYYARDEITAFYLAQEGLEYIRALRDQNYLAARTWLSGLEECVSASCTVDMPHFTASACSQSGCSPLQVDSNSGLFNTTTGTPSPFTRTVTLLPVEGTPSEITANVKVSWVSAGISRSFTLSEHMFDWM